MHLGGTGVGLLVAGLNLHNGLGNPDVGRDAKFILVSEKLVLSCYSDDTPDGCAARLRGKAGSAMEKLSKLHAEASDFVEGFWQADENCSIALGDIDKALESELVADKQKVLLKAARANLTDAWMRKAKEGVEAKKLDPAILGTGDKVASTD
jgi:hypothetical protein